MYHIYKQMISPLYAHYIPTSSWEEQVVSPSEVHLHTSLSDSALSDSIGSPGRACLSLFKHL